MKRRIVKYTCLRGVTDPSVALFPIVRFVVQIQNENGEWETELIPYVDEIKEKEPAVFYSKEGALKYINELSDKIGSEVVWESEN